MQINIIIKNKKHKKFLNKVFNVTYDILSTFIKNCPKEYKCIIPKLKKTPILVWVNTKIRNYYAEAYYLEKNKKITALTVEYSENLMLKVREKNIKLVAAHELAHSIDYLLRGINNDYKHHDKEWKKLAVLLNAQPSCVIDFNKKGGKI